METSTLDIESLDYYHNYESECVFTIALAICVMTTCSNNGT
jgi:hypothetical protein